MLYIDMIMQKLARVNKRYIYFYTHEQYLLFPLFRMNKVSKMYQYWLPCLIFYAESINGKQCEDFFF